MRLPRPIAIAACAALFGCASTGAGPSVSSNPQLATTPLFAFHSNLWVNLHHFLYVTSRARLGFDAGRTAVSASLADTVGFGQLSAAQRAAWNAALDYYTTSIAKRDILFDTALVTVTNQLAAAEGATSLRAAGLDPQLAAALGAAAPVYRALWWPRHDVSNRRWTNAAFALLATGGAATAAAEGRIFHHPWSSQPIRVDVGAYTNWAGAYTTEFPSHVNIAAAHSENQGVYAYETLFHEVLHTMDDSLLVAIEHAFHDAGKRSPRNPTHAFIFFTAGELTARSFPGHVPYAEHAGLWTRSPDFARFLPLLRQHWVPYMDGTIALDESLRRIVAAY